ncbi:MAG: ADOP family duplicated permease [Candidatus Acidiferrales bacterium]
MRWWRRKSRDEDLDREIRSHLELEAKEQEENGVSPDEARYAAKRALGNTTQVKENAREAWGWSGTGHLLRDLGYAIRMLRKNPAFSIVAVVSLALGIGANTAIFSLIEGIWMRPMAVPKPGEIVRLFSVTNQNSEGDFSYPGFLALQHGTTAFQGLVACGGRGIEIPNNGAKSELHTVNVVSDNFFSALGIRPVLGRLFTPKLKNLLNREPVAVLGNSFWKSHFDADPNIIGKQIELERGAKQLSFTILGVLPPTFRGIHIGGDRDFWFPVQSWVLVAGSGDLQNRGFRWFRVLGRLRPRVSIGEANAQVQSIASHIAADWPQTNRGRSARVMSDLSYRLQQAGANGVILAGAVLLLVLLCSVNVANLLLARGARRSREMAVRAALGAGRWRIVRQLMTENIVLGLAGLVAGLALGWALIQLLPSLLVLPSDLAAVFSFNLDSRVLALSILVAFGTIFLFGLAPAWNSSKSDLVSGLKECAASADRTGRRLQPRRWLAVSQIAISLVLLAGTGLLVRSFVNTRTLEYGISHKPLLEVWIQASGAQRDTLYHEALNRIRQFSAVKEAAFASRTPLSFSEGDMSQLVTFPERPETALQPVEIKYNSISSNYLQVMGTRLLSGRWFNQIDQTSGPPVVLISQTMARRFWGGKNPIGKLIRLKTADNQDYRVIGVVQDVPINQIGERPEPYMYLPYWRNPTDSMTFVAETHGDPLSLAQPVRRQLVSLSHELNPSMIYTQHQLIDYSAVPFQMSAELVSTLGFLGLLLTAVGLYGVIAYGVAQRTREIGIRMALGADRGTILSSVLREVTILGAIGIAIGLPIALFAAQSASAMLFGIAPWDPVTFCGAAVLLAVVLLAAGAIPARHASKVDPMVALRYE